MKGIANLAHVLKTCLGPLLILITMLSIPPTPSSRLLPNFLQKVDAQATYAYDTYNLEKADESVNFDVEVGSFLSYQSKLLSTLTTLQTSAKKFSEVFANKDYGICFRGLEVDLPLESGNFSLSKLFGKVGVIEMTSARRKYVTSGPLDCHLCYIQTGAFQQTASKFRGSNDIVFISILEHAHHWGADFTENCNIWVRRGNKNEPPEETQSSYMILTDDGQLRESTMVSNYMSPHYMVIDCRPCEGGPRELELSGQPGCFVRAVIPDVWNPSIYFTTIYDVRTETEFAVENWLNILPPPACG